MIVDASALLAVLFAEENSYCYEAAIATARQSRMSPVNWLEAVANVLRRSDMVGLGMLDDLVRVARIRIEPITEEQALIARHAHVAFGKGRHPAGLDLGDCFAYALAKATGEALLFKGNDFARTDVTPAIA
ncbi:MAG: type II toxin-antitoxin system VapC family toxin [Alphaproteobacteria bacterium]|nr:type II toxin-antitoxin system VapC family toxin [Alphaproteobacteria bacterium]